MATYYWFTAAGGDWSDSSFWSTIDTSGVHSPAGPPSSADSAQLLTGVTIGGTGSARYIIVGAAGQAVVFNGAITAATVSLGDASVLPQGYGLVVQSGALNVSSELLVGFKDTLLIGGGGSVQTPASGQVGFLNDGTSVIDGGGTLSGGSVINAGTLYVHNGAANLGTLSLISFTNTTAGVTENGFLSIAAGMQLTSTFGILNAPGAQADVDGFWRTSQLSLFNGIINVSSSGTLGVVGGASLYPGQPALQIGNAGGSGTISVNNTTGLVSVVGDAAIGALGNGDVLFTGGTFGVTGTITLGDQGTGNGLLQLIGNTATLSAGSLVVGHAGIGTLDLQAGSGAHVTGTLAGTGIVTIDGSTLTVDGGISLTANSGRLNLSNGATLTGPSSLNATVDIASAIDISGTSTLQGRLFDLSGSVHIAHGTLAANLLTLTTQGSQANATVDAGGVMNAFIANIGAKAADKNLVTVNTSGTLQSTASLMVGGAGVGAIAIQGGLVKASGGVSEGDAALDLGALGPAARGTIAMDGAGSALLVTGSAVFGDAGVGSVLVGTLATVHISGDLYEGAQSTGDGTLQMIDASDNFSVGGNWVLGDLGTHTDTISGGAAATVGGNLTLARNGGTGTLTVTGSGSLLTVAGNVAVGQVGTGSMNIEAGASLSVGGELTALIGTIDVGQGSSIGATDILLVAGTTLTMSSGTLSPTTSLEVGGLISGSGTISAPVTLSGTIMASNGSLTITGDVTGHGTIGAGGGGTIDVQGMLAAGSTLSFSGAGRVQLDHAPAGTLAVSGFASGDTIALHGVVTNTATFVGNTLTLDPGGLNQLLTFSGGYSDENFAITALGNQTTITYVACFAEGTGIATPAGRVPVERLRAGDAVLTASGAVRRLVWVGHRGVSLRGHADPELLWPIRIRGNAVAEGIPSADLLVSPDHALFIDGLLIPAHALVNGDSIVQHQVDAVTYWHLELETHDILLAENMPAESYLDTGNRRSFAGDVTALHPNFAGAPEIYAALGAAPLATDPARVRPIWQRLARRTAAQGALSDDPQLSVSVGGQSLRPRVAGMGLYVFVLPEATRFVVLASRTARPSDHAPWTGDRRVLGVAVDALRFDGSDVPLENLRQGWHAIERDAQCFWRWTDGAARVPVPPGARVLEVSVTGTLRYRSEARDHVRVVNTG